MFNVSQLTQSSSRRAKSALGGMAIVIFKIFEYGLFLIILIAFAIAVRIKYRKNLKHNKLFKSARLNANVALS